MARLLSPKQIVRSGLCIGCGSCVAQASSPVVHMKMDAYGELKPHSYTAWMNDSMEQFNRTCPFAPLADNEDSIAATLFPAAGFNSATGRFHSAFVGYVSEENYRMQGSSGGMVSWVATELLKRGLIDGVAHVVALDKSENDGRYFGYRISHTEAAIRKGAKSRYYPVEMSDILKTIRELPGRYAVVGIPCFIKAVQLLRKEDTVYQERIKYTLGLFCGHMKSSRFVESFAWQMKVTSDDIVKVEFRHKNPDRPANLYHAMLTLRSGQVVSKDWWHLADGDWGAGFFMNNACNFCDDVMAETADISFGDAWVEPYASDGKGTNVIVCRTEEITKLLQEAIKAGRLRLQTVDSKFVEQSQAAGLRQRREGLAYRLTWAPAAKKVCKRVKADAKSLTAHRKRIYRMRYYISLWSRRIFYIADRLKKPNLYIGWARFVAAIYHGLAYHKGKYGEIVRRFSQLKRSK